VLRVLIALAGLVVLAALLQAALEWSDARAMPMRGRLVDLGGGERLRLIEAGAGQPGPTVVLECGIGGATAASWGWIVRGVSAFAPVVAYDRAGLGWSTPGPMPRDGKRLVAELHELLAASGHAPPYVFVGHSYGGLLARLFADRWPDEIAGVVLVDSSHPRQFGDPGRLPSRYRWIRRLLPVAPLAAGLGLTRLAVWLAPMDGKHLPQPERREQMAFLARTSHWRGTERELQAWLPLTNPEAAATRGFGDKPLAVISADHGRTWGGWARLQAESAALSTNSAMETVAGATHGGLLSDSLPAQHVIAAVRAVRDVALHGGRVTRGAAAAPAAAR
jgi:pimeloyl-ACP methyl ester carboxylesterase